MLQLKTDRTGPARGLVLVGVLTVMLAMAQSGASSEAGAGLAVSITAPPDGSLVAASAASPLPFAGEASIGEGSRHAYLFSLELSDHALRGWGEQDWLAVASDALVALNDANRHSGVVDEVALTGYSMDPFRADMSPVDGHQVFTHPAASGPDGFNVDVVVESSYVEPAGPAAPSCPDPGDDDDPDCPPGGGSGSTDPTADAGGSGFREFSPAGVAGSGHRDVWGALRNACSTAEGATSPHVTLVLLPASSHNPATSVSGTSYPPCEETPVQAFLVLPPWMSCAETLPFPLGHDDDEISLNELADASGGGCLEAADQAELVALTAALAPPRPTLASVGLHVNDGRAVPPSELSPALPVDGPGSVQWAQDLRLAPGVHEVCAIAAGTDSVEHGEAISCHEVTVAVLDLTPDAATRDLAADDHQTVVAAVAGIPNLAVDFEVIEGPSTGATGSGFTDAAGEVVLSWTNPQQSIHGLGTDILESCFTDDLGNRECAQAEIQWADLTPPQPQCSVTEPSPAAADDAAAERGLFRLGASDVIDADPQIFVRDTGSGTVFGPFADGDEIKYTRAPDAPPMQHDASALTAAHLIGNGEPEVFATDFSGNTSDPVDCTP